MSELKPCPFCGEKMERSDTMYDMALCSNIDCWFYAVYIPVRVLNSRPIEGELRAEIARLKEENHALDQINHDIQTAAAHLDEVLAELARKGEELKIKDDLLKEATETIGAVVACCTYNSNDDAKIGIYGVDQKAFTRIDQFITHYNDAVSARKVSVDVKPVKRDLSDAEIEELGAQEAERKEFCPNCEAETPCTHEAELYVCDICGEDFAKYIVSRSANVSDVSTTQDVITPEPHIRGGDGSHWEGCAEVHWDCRIAQLENAVRMLADKLLVSPVGYMSIQEYNELVKMVKKVLRLDDFVGDSDHEHDDRIL